MAYLWSMALIAIGVAAQALLTARFGPLSPAFTVYPAIAASALIGGPRVGLFALAVAMVGVWNYWIAGPSGYPFSPETQAVRVILFAVTGASIVLISGAYRGSLLRIEKAQLAGRMGDWELDVGSGRMSWSPALNALLPRSLAAQKASLNTLLAAVHPDDRQAISAALEAPGSGAGAEVEFRVLQDDGSYRWVAARGESHRRGGRLLMSGVALDINERKQLEDRLRRSEAEARDISGLLEAIGASSPDLIYAKDRKLRTIYANDATLKTLGLPRDAVLGRTAAEYASNPPEGKAHADNDRWIMETGEIGVVDEVFTSPDGATRVYSSTKAPLRDASGEVVGIVGVSVDVTERRAAENRLKRHSQQLQQLAEAALAVARAESQEAKLETITKAARLIIGAHQGVCSLTQGPDWRQSINTVDLTTKYADWEGYQTPPDGSGIYALVCEENRPLRLSQAELLAHPRWRGFGRHANDHPPMRGWLAVPLIGGDGRNLGLIQLSDKEDGSEFDENDEAMLVQLAQLASAAVEQSKASAKLRQVEQRYRSLFEQPAVGIIHVSVDNALIEVNQRFCEMLGYERQELLGRSFLEITHPEDREADLAAAKALHDGDATALQREKRYIRKDGLEAWAEVLAFVVKGDARGPEHRVLIVQDISARRRAEEGLRESESRLRLAIEAGRMAVWDHDARTEEVRTSPELNRLLGYEDDAQLDLNEVRASYYPGDRERLLAAVSKTIERGERFFEAEYRLYRRDGELRWFLMRAEFLQTLEGTPLRTTGVLLDVTEQKRTEQALREREAELKAALDAGELAIVDYDHVTGSFAPSPRLSTFYGYPAHHNLTIADVRARYHPDDVQSVMERAAAEHADPTVRNFVWTLRLIMPDGSIRWVEGRGEYLRDETGHVLRSRGVVVDITEQKRWEEHQRLLINELNHRVKNTLTIVQGLAQQTFRRSIDPADARAAFDARLTALSATHNLLTEENWEAASLQEIVETAVRATASSGVQLTWNGPDVKLAPQTAVSFALAVHELCTNAIKYGALSVETGRVHVESNITTRGGEPRLSFRWREIGGPAVVQPTRRGFGTEMIERGLAGQLGGSARVDFRPEGLVCEIEAPLPNAARPEALAGTPQSSAFGPAA
jgi:PAS domain S-box-containing protein